MQLPCRLYPLDVLSVSEALVSNKRQITISIESSTDSSAFHERAPKFTDEIVSVSLLPNTRKINGKISNKRVIWRLADGRKSVRIRFPQFLINSRYSCESIQIATIRACARSTMQCAAVATKTIKFSRLFPALSSCECKPM